MTVVNVDSGTKPQPEDVPLFATDNVAAARKVPDLLAEELGKKGGDVAFIPFQQGTLTNELREQGFKEGLKAHPELKLVAEQSSQSDYNTALTVTENILTANPGRRHLRRERAGRAGSRRGRAPGGQGRRHNHRRLGREP